MLEKVFLCDVKIVPRSPSHKKNFKDPRFVPYEPYVGAISSFIPVKPKPRRRPRQSRRRKRVICEKKDSLELQRLNEDKDASKDVDILELTKCLKEYKMELRMQTQVNQELKKLLIASVGEGVEARVNFLTEDKLRLVDDVKRYSDQIHSDSEEKELLSVQSNVWKTKFLACSLTVDELSRRKNIYCQNLQDFSKASALILSERNLLWNSLVETWSIFEQLNLIPQSPNYSRSIQPEYSLVELAKIIHEASKGIRRRLSSCPNCHHTSVEEVIISPPKLSENSAEIALRQLLENGIETNQSWDDATTQVTNQIARPHLEKLSENLKRDQMAHMTKSCKYCQGNVKIV